MQHGTRVASIEAAIGGDMTPGRDARWTYLGPLDQEAPEQDPPQHNEPEQQEPEHDEPEVANEEPEP